MKLFTFLFLLAGIINTSKAQCPVLNGAMINACGVAEGSNEFAIFTTGVTGPASDYALNYGTGNPPNGNSLSGSDAAPITGTGSVTGAGCTIVNVTNPATSIPAGSKVIFIPAGFDQAYDVTSLCSGATLYVISVKTNANGGTNSNWSATGTMSNTAATPRYLQITDNSVPGCNAASAPVQQYTATSFPSNTDGNFVTWNSAGTPVYSNNGCALIILPVSLISLTATESNGRNIVRWQTGEEVNLNELVVEKSYDAVNYTNASAESPKGNNSFYQFIEPSDKRDIFYRIKAIDHDHKESLSDIAKINGTKNGTGINCYPRLASGTMNIEWFSDKKMKAAINVMDMNGSIILIKAIDAHYGPNKTALDITALAAGRYFIRLFSGDRQITDSFVKQ